MGNFFDNHDFIVPQQSVRIIPLPFLFLGNEGSELYVSGEMPTVIVLQDDKCATNAGSCVVLSANDFMKCVYKNDREFCLSLLNNSIPSGVSGQIKSKQYAYNSSSHTNDGRNNLVRQLKILVSGVFGCFAVLAGTLLGYRLANS